MSQIFSYRSSLKTLMNVASTMMLKNRIFGVVMCLCMLVLSACNSNKVEPIAATNASITFSVNWQYIDKAATKPESITLWLYPRYADGLVQAIEIVDDKAVSLNLKEGLYDMIAYNSKTLSNLKTFEQEDFMTHNGILPLLNEDIEGPLGVVGHADYLHSLTGSTPRVLEVKAEVPLAVTLNPRTVTKKYTVNMSVNSNVEIKGGNATLQGVKRKVVFSNAAILSEGLASVNFPLESYSKAQGSFVGNAYILGIETVTENPQIKNIIKVKLDYVDPLRPPLEADFDITNEVDNNPNVNLDINASIDITGDKPIIHIKVIPYEIVDGGDFVIDPL